MPLFHYEYASYVKMEKSLAYFGLRFRGGLVAMIIRKKESTANNEHILYKHFEVINHMMAGTFVCIEPKLTQVQKDTLSLILADAENMRMQTSKLDTLKPGQLAREKQHAADYRLAIHNHVKDIVRSTLKDTSAAPSRF